MQAVILCGGQGSRISSIARGRQKCLLNVAGVPFLYHVIKVLQTCDVTSFHFLAGYRHADVSQFLDHHFAGVRKHVHVEERPRGTIGAIRAAYDYLEDEFLVILGDVLPSLDPSKIMQMKVAKGLAKADMVLQIAPASHSLDRGNVSVNAQLVETYSKRHLLPLIDRGARLFTKVSLEKFKGDNDDNFISAAVEARKVAYLVDFAPVLDIGTPDSFHRLCQVVTAQPTLLGR